MASLLLKQVSKRAISGIRPHFSRSLFSLTVLVEEDRNRYCTLAAAAVIGAGAISLQKSEIKTECCGIAGVVGKPNSQHDARYATCSCLICVCLTRVPLPHQ